MSVLRSDVPVLAIRMDHDDVMALPVSLADMPPHRVTAPRGGFGIIFQSVVTGAVDGLVLEPAAAKAMFRELGAWLHKHGHVE